MPHKHVSVCGVYIAHACARARACMCICVCAFTRIGACTFPRFPLGGRTRARDVTLARPRRVLPFYRRSSRIGTHIARDTSIFSAQRSSCDMPVSYREIPESARSLACNASGCFVRIFVSAVIREQARRASEIDRVRPCTGTGNTSKRNDRNAWNGLATISPSISPSRPNNRESRRLIESFEREKERGLPPRRNEQRRWSLPRTALKEERGPPSYVVLARECELHVSAFRAHAQAESERASGRASERRLFVAARAIPFVRAFRSLA